MCGGTPDLLGAASTSNMYFASTEVPDVAARALAELMGGVMEVAEAPTKSGASAPSSSVGGNFYIGDSDDHEMSGANDAPASTGSTSADDTAAPLSSDVVMRDDTEGASLTSSAANNKREIGAAPQRRAPQLLRRAPLPLQQVVATSSGASGVHHQGAVSKGSASSLKTSGTSAASTKLGKTSTSNDGAPAATSNERGPEWLLKTETGLKGTHQLLWPDDLKKLGRYLSLLVNPCS